MSERTLETGQRTHPGPREVNQDAVLTVALDDGVLLVAVADGMGGLAEGELASRLAMDVLARRLEAGHGLSEAVRDANRAVHRQAGGDGMGTTLVAARIGASGLEIAHVGDSRAYHLGPLGLSRLTRDHTFASDAARTGELTAREVGSSRWGAALSRFLGASEEVEVDEIDAPALGDDEWLLLCTDGVYKSLQDREIESLLRSARDAVSAAEELVGSALESGCDDNVSALVVHHPSGAPPSRTEPRAPQGTDPAAWDPRHLTRLSRKTLRSRPWRAPQVLGIVLLVVAVVTALYLAFL